MEKRRILRGVYTLTLIGVLCLIVIGSRTVEVISANLPMERTHCFIIDAGHGGVDGGAVSCTGRPESTYNLEISLRLRDLIHFLGYRTKMIRSEDISVYTSGETIAEKKISDLKERVRVCNETEGAILLSIHQNTFSDSRYSGAQVFFSGTEGSDQLAERAQEALVRSLNPGSNRKAKKSSGVYLLEHINCPGILIECGFLSNPEEEARLRSKDYQKEMCCVIAVAAVTHIR